MQTTATEMPPAPTTTAPTCVIATLALPEMERTAQMLMSVPPTNTPAIQMQPVLILKDHSLVHAIQTTQGMVRSATHSVPSQHAKNILTVLIHQWEEVASVILDIMKRTIHVHELRLYK